MIVERLFLAVPRGCLQFVIVVFPHLLFLNTFENIMENGAFASNEQMLRFPQYFQIHDKRRYYGLKVKNKTSMNKKIHDLADFHMKIN